MKRAGKIILAVLVAACLVFIWGNSAMPGEESGELSGDLLAWLKQVFPFFAGLNEHILRKATHFLEFCGTFLLVSWGCLLAGQKGIHRVTMPLLFAVLTAAIDETIQIYSPGRASSLLDVWVDVAGACTGIAAFWLLCGLWTLWKKRKEK